MSLFVAATVAFSDVDGYASTIVEAASGGAMVGSCFLALVHAVVSCRRRIRSLLLLTALVLVIARWWFHTPELFSISK